MRTKAYFILFRLFISCVFAYRVRSLRFALLIFFRRLRSRLSIVADRLSRVSSAFALFSRFIASFFATVCKRFSENFLEDTFESSCIVCFTFGWRIVEIIFTVNEFIERVPFLFIQIGSVGFFKQASGKGVGIEGLQVVQSLAHADEFDGQLQFVFDGKHHAAPGGAVQLGQHDAGQFRHLHEFPRLIDRILPGGGVQHQQDFPVRVGQFLIHHAVDLGQLVHQVLFVVKAPGGIADDDIHVPRNARLQRVEDHRRGVSALLVLDDIHACPVRPHGQLVDGRRAEGIRRAQQHLFALGFVHGRHLADGGGLTRAVDADHQDHGGDGDEAHVLAAVQQLRDDVLQLLFDLAGFLDLLAFDALLELLHHLHGGVDAHVAHHENFL